jgi:hypothetical protein
MPDHVPSTGEAPSAETLKERVGKLHEEQDLGAGNQEPDPATAENPPSQGQQGDRERDPD